MTAVLWVALALGAADPPAQVPQPAPKPADATVSGVTVSGARASLETSIDRRSYVVADDVQAQTGSVADVLRNIPSVQVDLQGHVSLRGDRNVTVLVDGKPSSQFSGESLAQALQTVPASQIDRIEVITNPSAEFRADGSGGIINLVMKKAKGTGRTAGLRLQAGTSGRAVASGNLGFNSDRLNTVADVSYRLDHQVSVTDNQQSAPDPVSGLLLNNHDLDRGHLSQEVANAHVGSDYDLSASTRLSGGLRLAYFHGDQPSLDRFEQDGSSGAPITAFSRIAVQQGTQYNGDATAGLRHVWSEGRDLVLTGAYDLMQYKRHRFDVLTPNLPPGPDQTAAFDRHTRYRRAAFAADFEAPMPGKARLKLGYDFEYSATVFGHTAASGGAGGTAAPDPTQTGSFLDDEIHNQAYVTYGRPFGRLDTQAGLRGEVLHLALDAQPLNARSGQTYGRLYPSLHLAYDLTDGHKLTASYSRRVDRPSYALLDPIPYPQNPGFVFQGNEALKPQDTNSAELGFEAHKNVASLLATLYSRQTANAFSSLYVSQPNGTLVQQMVNAGRQRNGGLEIVLADKLTPKLTYSVTADAYWTALSAPNLGFSQTAHTVTGFGRANLNWRVTDKDAFQFNIFVNGKTLLPQGYVEPFASGNIGYRHTVNSKVSWMVVIQDPFNSVRTREVLKGAGGSDRRTDTANNRMASLTLVRNFSGKPQAAEFDFKSGGYGAAAAP